MKRKAGRPKKSRPSRTRRTNQTPEKQLAALVERHRLGHTAMTALALARFCYSHGLEDRLLEILEPFAGHVEGLSQENRIQLLAFLSLGFAHEGRLVDAETTAQRLADDSPGSADAWYVLCYVHLSMREYEKAVLAGVTYRSVVNGPETTNKQSQAICSTNAHQSQLCNMLATAHRETGRLDDAEQWYRQAISLDQGNHLPYLNLIDLLKKRERYDEAADLARQGLRDARQIQELRMLDTAAARRATVSACMIVKDEEEMLPDCLGSIRDWVDEIILVDTGSTDRTVEIAQRYGARIFHQAWEGDFSKARNFSLSHATGDWIFIIDADERMFPEDVPFLRRLLDTPSVEVISINVYNVYADNQSAVTFLPSTRLFRRALQFHYEGIVHNALVYPENQQIVRTGVRLKHLGYGLDKEKMQKKLARSRRLLEQQLAENPDNAFALFNYAQLLRGETATFPMHNAELILKSARRAVELTRPDVASERHIYLMCLDQIAWTLYHQGNLPLAEEHAVKALCHKPNYLDPLLLLGHIAARQMDYDNARIRYTDYLRAQESYDVARETDNIIMLHIDSRVSAWYSLGMIAEIQGDPEQASQFYELVADRDPGYLESYAHLGRLALQRHDLDAAEHWFQRHHETHPGSLDACRHLGQILIASHKPQKAAEIFRLGLEMVPYDSVCLAGLTRVAAESGDPADAIHALEQEVEADPSNKGVQRELAAVYFRAGRFKDASQILHQLVAEVPTDAELLNGLGNCYFKMEQFDAAERAYRTAIAQPEPPAYVWRNLGLTLLREGNQASATEALEKYVCENHDADEIASILAGLYFRAERYSDALGLLEKQLRSKPTDVSTLFTLSECYLKMGHEKSAIIGYRRVLELSPGFEPAQKRLTELAATPAAV